MNAETWIGIVGTLVAAIYSLAQGWKIYQELQASKWGAAMKCLEAGVEQTYQTYVKVIKDASADGTLTDDERSKARDMAVTFAVNYGKTQGIDVLTTLGKGYIDVAIARIVNQAKDPTVAPAATATIAPGQSGTVTASTTPATAPGTITTLGK